MRQRKLAQMIQRISFDKINYLKTKLMNNYW